MIVLGIDTSGYVNAVGIVDSNRTLIDASFPSKTDSLEQIVDNIDSTIKKAGLALKDIQGMGVGLGPGSWTGIKVGVTVGKMLAFSMNKPVAGISTLEALAYVARHESKPIFTIISAGIGNAVYAARYRVSGNKVIRESDYFTGDIKNLASFISELVTLVGNNIQSYGEMIIKENASLKEKIKAIEASPSGAAIACLAATRLEQGRQDEPLSLTPLYLKESTAKVFRH